MCLYEPVEPGVVYEHQLQCQQWKQTMGLCGHRGVTETPGGLNISAHTFANDPGGGKISGGSGGTQPVCARIL